MRLDAAAAGAAGSLPVMRSGGSGGRRIATWLNPARLPRRVWEVLRTSWYGTMDVFCSGMSGEVPAAMWSERGRRVGTKVSLFAGFVRSGSVRSGSDRRTCRVAEPGLSVSRRHSSDGSPLPGALRGAVGRVAKGSGHDFRPVLTCWCCFTSPKDGTLCFVLVNFVFICIHRGLPSQTHWCWASTVADVYFRYQSTK